MREVPVPAGNLDAATRLTAASGKQSRGSMHTRHAPGVAVERVILFGSRARREGHEGSDIDLAVILAGRRPHCARSWTWRRS